MDDLISRQAVIDALEKVAELYPWRVPGDRDSYSSYNEAWQDALNRVENEIEALPSAQPDIEKICTRIKAEAIKRNVEYMKHGDRYMLGFVDGMRLARRIVDGTIDDPVYFTLSGE